MTQRIDSLDRYYNKVNTFKSVSTLLFWLNALLSLGIFFVDKMEMFKDILTTVFIIMTVLYFVIDNYLSVFLIPNVEEKRRTHLLSNSFGIQLDNETTNEYYNNNLEPSIMRLGANILENSLFAKKVTSEMVKGERIIILLYVLIWIGCLSMRNNDLELISIISQTLFASTLIPSYVRLEILCLQNQKIHDELYRVFLLQKNTPQKKIIPLVLDAFVKYESAKAYSGVKQSTKVFRKINPDVTREWENIKQNLKI
ncbi:hypothetical protein COE92_16335 [Bacillus wiedmannii]|uniref:hypothetical protein n=1 Tax=Bacillus wiedmannii TaxID=1890302 RepID=UPI0007ABCB09|nr:hypothetical protein [Bacillus wiedmannii]KZD43496.1 hypothetical protein B4083_0896 [Bacillus cereus]PHB53962.1 hypothetical protein COE92_16335 [Bacillus wiedmannii]